MRLERNSRWCCWIVYCMMFCRKYVTTFMPEIKIKRLSFFPSQDIQFLGLFVWSFTCTSHPWTLHSYGDVFYSLKPLVYVWIIIWYMCTLVRFLIVFLENDGNQTFKNGSNRCWQMIISSWCHLVKPLYLLVRY